jgi:DNA topoisomerase-1
MANLVIVESAAKAKIIEKYLNDSPELKKLGTFRVIASLGHICDLPVKELGINTTDWSVSYIPLSKKTAVLKNLKSGVKDAKFVYIATDMDLEGNAIAYHLKTFLNLKNNQYKRVLFNEITKKALVHSFLHPTDIDMNAFAAQETRRILDRLVGYELSPLLWKRFTVSTLSAGRVQSAALQMIVKRYKEVDTHIPELYWVCHGQFTLDLKATVYEIKNSQKAYQWNTVMKDSMLSFFNHCITQNNTLKIQYSKKTLNKSPSAPFTTSTYQQDAYDRYKISAKTAMSVAQGLYEAGHITYMRTDSVQLSKDAQKSILEYIDEEVGPNLKESREYITKTQNAQEAHEAIRPSNPSFTGESLEDLQKKLYILIWRRAVASQMISAQYAEISYQIEIPNQKKFIFIGKKSFLIRRGYLQIYSPDLNEEHSDLQLFEKNKTVPIQLNQLKAENNVSQPKALYVESSLVKGLEKKGIGRPSTYASIIDKLYTKTYIHKGKQPQKNVDVAHYEWSLETKLIEEKKDSIHIGSKETDRLLPTSLGERVIEYLEPIVPFLLDVEFTSHMESDLDKIVNQTSNKSKILESFYKIFHDAVTNAHTVIKNTSATKPKDGSQKKPPIKNESILKEYRECNAIIMKTRYGPALFKIDTDTFYSIEPFLSWKKKTYETLETQDIRFILSFPISFKNTSRKIYMGRYGLYVKDETQSYILPEEKWDDVYDGSISIQYVLDLSPLVSKPKWLKGQPAEHSSSKGQRHQKKATMKIENPLR